MNVIANEDITAKKVFVIGTDGEKIGEMNTAEAIALAEKEETDLVVISAGKDMPIAKITNINKYLYEQKQKEKQRKRNNKVLDVKEIRVSPNIAKNDLNTKINSARKFLAAGHEVKLTLVCRGREAARITQFSSILSNIVTELNDCSLTKFDIKIDGRNASTVLKPKKAV